MNHKCDLLREKGPTVLKREMEQLIARIQPRLKENKLLLFLLMARCTSLGEVFCLSSRIE